MACINSVKYECAHLRGRRLDLILIFDHEVVGTNGGGLCRLLLLRLHQLPDLTTLEEIFVDADVGSYTGLFAFLTSEAHGVLAHTLDHHQA